MWPLQSTAKKTLNDKRKFGIQHFLQQICWFENKNKFSFWKRSNQSEFFLYNYFATSINLMFSILSISLFSRKLLCCICNWEVPFPHFWLNQGERREFSTGYFRIAKKLFRAILIKCKQVSYLKKERKNATKLVSKS